MRIHLLFLLISIPSTLCIFMNNSISSKYDSIFSFGDSLSDTGNMLLSGAKPILAIDKPPYGETYFHKPMGRCSDGRLVVDFIAEAFGVPKLSPYLASENGEDFRRGVNFAVAGATALDTKFYYGGLDAFLWTNYSLNVQLDWFKKLKTKICNKEEDCAKFLGKSLFFMGEIGGNDYNFPFLMGQTIEDVRKFVPKVIEAIVNATKEGAVDPIVPGISPLGCAPIYLSLYKSSNKGDYDPRNKCLAAYNKFCEYHNSLLKAGLAKLRRQYTHANIIYADYYNPTMHLFNSPQSFGFKSDVILSACCGGGDLYNFNISALCGKPGSKSCDDPSTYVNWDGIHLTEAAYLFMAKELIRGL